MKTIILMGPRHCGKTTTAKALTGLLKKDKDTGEPGLFVDTDELMKIQTGKTPRELFNAGKEIFAAAEYRALYYALKSGAKVIACGGGFSDNVAAINYLDQLKKDGAGIIKVYLEVSVSTAWERIKRKPLPPFLQTENPEAAHKEIHERRSEIYKNIADIVIDTEKLNQQDIALKIIELT